MVRVDEGQNTTAGREETWRLERLSFISRKEILIDKTTLINCNILTSATRHKFHGIQVYSDQRLKCKAPLIALWTLKIIFKLTIRTFLQFAYVETLFLFRWSLANPPIWRMTDSAVHSWLSEFSQRIGTTICLPSVKRTSGKLDSSNI
mgnify:CR=1 FL=1